MAKFKPGDRVRIVGNVTDDVLGREGTITSGLVEGECDITGEVYWGHEIDIDGIGPMDSDGVAFGLEPENLEHLTRPDASTETDRNKVVPWSDCEWMPAHLRESA